MASIQSAGTGRGRGAAMYGSFLHSSNTLNAGVNATLVTRDYAPPTGFVSGADLVVTNATIGRDVRPSWRPRWLRRFYPYLGATLYHSPSDRRLEQTYTEAYIDLEFQNGALIYPDLQHSVQRLRGAFSPVRGVTVAPGNYSNLREVFFARSDPSARWAATTTMSTGGYFDRTLDEADVRLRFTPSARASLALSYDVKHFRAAPASAPNVTTHLFAPELRLALNPRLQMTTFYQYNTDIARGALNTRVSWEFAPLSYLYFVTQDVRAAGPDARAIGPRQSSQQATLKIVWLRPL